MGFREKVQPFVFFKWLPSLIASLRHYIALYHGNIVPLPGTKRYVGRENPHSLFYSSLFTKSPETPINTGVPRGEGLAHLFTTLHPLFTWIFYSSDYTELTEHSCSTDYARILNGSSTCSVFEEGPTDLAFPSAADFQFTDLHRFSVRRLSSVRRPSGFTIRCKKKGSTYKTGGFAIPLNL